MDEMSRRERRVMVKRAMVSQMRILVGRRTMAMAARSSEMRRRGVDRERILLKEEFSLMDWGVERICQGKWARAAMVRVVSRELENVRDEQYHCHGLKSWSRILGC